MNGPAFVRFSQLAREHVNRDLQIHTRATDGEARIHDIIARAEQLELDEIAFTEHVRRGSEHVPQYLEEVRRARRAASVRIYVGFEVKVTDADGTLDISLEDLTEGELILGSVHRFPDGAGRFEPANQFPPAVAAKREFELSLALLRRAPIHVLAHPGGMCQRAFGGFPVEYLEALMRTSLERGIAMEINTSYTRDLDGFLVLCRKIDPLVSIGSDVHKLSELGTCRNALWARGIGCRSLLPS